MRAKSRIVADMDHRATLLTLADAYSSATGKSLARVATLCARDGKFFKRIAAGRSCTFPVFDRTVQWFSDNWPTGASWPAGLPRPKKSNKTAEAA